MDLLWKQYEKHIDLYKFYIDAVIFLMVLLGIFCIAHLLTGVSLIYIIWSSLS